MFSFTQAPCCSCLYTGRMEIHCIYRVHLLYLLASGRCQNGHWITTQRNVSRGYKTQDVVQQRLLLIDGWTGKRGKLHQRMHELQTPQQIAFHYLYGGNGQRQTETRNNLNCPFCNVKCPMLYALLKHLRLNHPRFHFTYSVSCRWNTMVRIVVSGNCVV